MKFEKFSHAIKRLGKLWKGLAVVLVLAGITYGGISAYDWHKNHVWPNFPRVEDKTDPTPQAIIVVVGRDYAYHIGDPVHLKLYIKQSAGTEVDAQTLSIGDTFELAEKPVVTPRNLEDGSTIYRLELTVQSFVVGRDLPFTGTVAWKSGDQKGDLALPETHIYTSNTYDGRKNLMEGPDPRVSFYWYATRYALPLLVGTFVWLLLTVPAFRAWLKSLAKPVVVDHTRLRVVELLEKVRAGTSTKDEHLEMDGLVRGKFRTGPVPASQLELALYPASLIAFLKLNEPAIYAQGALSESDRADLYKKGLVVLGRWQYPPAKDSKKQNAPAAANSNSGMRSLH